MLQNAGVLDLIQKEMLFIFYRFSKCRLITSSSFTVRVLYSRLVLLTHFDKE